MTIDCCALCDVGLSRKENQDYVLARKGQKWGLFVVADGMGGHTNGSLASKTIVLEISKWIEEYADHMDDIELHFAVQQIKTVLLNANAEIIRKTPYGMICGSTVVILMIIRDAYFLIYAGDSRCYELKRKHIRYQLKQISRDEICDIPGPGFGKLTNAVGVNNPLKCNISTGNLNKQHLFLLCSDGVYKFCMDKDLELIVAGSRNDPETICRRIQQEVYKNGARDNLSAVAILVKDN